MQAGRPDLDIRTALTTTATRRDAAMALGIMTLRRHGVVNFSGGGQ